MATRSKPLSKFQTISLFSLMALIVATIIGVIIGSYSNVAQNKTTNSKAATPSCSQVCANMSICQSACAQLGGSSSNCAQICTNPSSCFVACNNYIKCGSPSGCNGGGGGGGGNRGSNSCPIGQPPLYCHRTNYDGTCADTGGCGYTGCPQGYQRDACSSSAVGCNSEQTRITCHMTDSSGTCDTLTGCYRNGTSCSDIGLQPKSCSGSQGGGGICNHSGDKCAPCNNACDCHEGLGCNGGKCGFARQCP